MPGLCIAMIICPKYICNLIQNMCLLVSPSEGQERKERQEKKIERQENRKDRQEGREQKDRQTGNREGGKQGGREKETI